jgi:hypothetical protein
LKGRQRYDDRAWPNELRESLIGPIAEHIGDCGETPLFDRERCDLGPKKQLPSAVLTSDDFAGSHLTANRGRVGQQDSRGCRKSILLPLIEL